MKTLLAVIGFIVTSLLVGAASFVLFFVMMVLMNGFNESDAAPGILLFQIWAGVFTLLAGVLSIVGTFLFSRKGMKDVSAVALAVVVAVAVGIVLNMIGVAAGLATASFVWSM